MPGESERDLSAPWSAVQLIICLSYFRCPDDQIQHLLDYIDQCHPGLREELSNLFAVLASAIDHGLPRQLLTIETISYQELRAKQDFNFEEMFQFSSVVAEKPTLMHSYDGRSS